MPKITLTTLFEEMKKRDARDDVRFEFLKEQIQSNHAEFRASHAELKAGHSELKTSFAGLKSEVSDLKIEVRTGFSQVHQELKVIRDQTAHITERVAALEHAKKENLSQ